MDMNGWTTTRVWLVNDTLVVAKTIDEALETMRACTEDDITSVRAVEVGHSSGNAAIIKE